MKIKNMQELLVDQLKDIYSAENQILKALPKLIKTASSEELKEGLQNHLRETEGQVERLEAIAQEMGAKLTGKKCKAMEGLIEEGKECLEIDAEEPLVDAAIIAACQRVEHYEISAYGTARTLAEQLGLERVVQLLQETLEEEEKADEQLTQVCESSVIPAAMELEGEEVDEDEAEEKTMVSKTESRSRRGESASR